MPINYYIILAIALFCIGVIGVLTRRNAIIIFMCIELMLNAVNLMLVAFSKMHYLKQSVENASAGIDGQLFVFNLTSCRQHLLRDSNHLLAVRFTV